MTMTLAQLKSMTQPARFGAFVEWLGEQPPETPYNYYAVRGCALCQFAKSVLASDDFRAGGVYIQQDGDFDQVEIMRLGIGFNSLVRCKTLGQLYTALLPHVTITPETVALTDAEMERLELRALVGIGGG